jgi:integrase
MKRLSEVKSSAALHWPLLAKLAIETGARLQELVLAEWSEISDEVEFWTIPETHTKSKKERVMPLTSGAIETLRALKAIRDQADARIFHALGNPTAVSAFFHRMTQQAGLVDFRFHDLRHEAISRLVLSQRNFSVYEILQMVGHSSPTMLNRYTNLRGDELAQKMIRIDAPAAAPLLVPKPSGSDTPKPPQENAAGTGSIPLLPSTVLFYGQPGSAAMKVWQPGGRGQPPTHH